MFAFKLGRRLIVGIAAATLAAATLPAAPAAAQERYAAIVVDGNTGRVLFSRNADASRFPASLTKMMTLYLLFDALDRGRLTLESRLRVSANAAAEPPSKLGVRAGSTVRVRDAILALVTRSANDVATVVAENLGGSVSGFAQQMTATARGLGMSRTTFRNPHGLPNAGQVTSARDMALLGRALQDRFPAYYGFFSTRVFEYNGARIGNHNNLLGRVEGVDGIKTGYTRASGYNLVTSVHRDNRYLVAVVLGGQSGASRDAHMRELIAEYLPRASRGERTAPLVLVAAAAVPAPDVTAPMPRPKPAIPEVMALAAAAPSAVAILAEMAEGDANAGDGPAPLASGRVATAAPLALAPVALPPEPIAPAAMELAAAPAAAPAPAAAAPTGWKIQIGALPTADGAERMLDRARDTLPQLLASLSPYTERVQTGNATLYRARFGGFASREAARSACTQLERRDFDCLALP